MDDAKTHRKNYDLVALAFVRAADEPHHNAMSAENAMAADSRSVTVELRAVWKGPKEDLLIVEHLVPSHAACGAPNLEVGVEYVLFARRRGDGWHVNACNPTKPSSQVSSQWLKPLGRPGWRPKERRP